jgi:hypothetical protein
LIYGTHPNTSKDIFLRSLQILFPSPFSSLAGQLSLLDTTHCKTILCPVSSLPLAEKIRNERPGLRIVMVPPLDEWIDDTIVTPYIYDKSFEEARDDPFMIIHTSGTTGKVASSYYCY